MSKKRSLPDSFKYAGRGFREIYKTEPNFRIHTVMGIAAVTLAAYVGFDIYEWLLLLFTIVFVLMMEMINTVFENLVDLVSPDKQEKAKVAKDVAAGAVLVAAVTSVIVGVVLFLPKI